MGSTHTWLQECNVTRAVPAVQSHKMKSWQLFFPCFSNTLSHILSMHMLVQISFLYLLLLYVIAKVQISYRVIRNQNLKCYAHCLCPVKYKNYSHFPCSISILFKIVWIITFFAFLVRKGDGFYLFFICEINISGSSCIFYLCAA